jgi:hypothetical protein
VTDVAVAAVDVWHLTDVSRLAKRPLCAPETVIILTGARLMQDGHCYKDTDHQTDIVASQFPQPAKVR